MIRSLLAVKFRKESGLVFDNGSRDGSGGKRLSCRSVLSHSNRRL